MLALLREDSLVEEELVDRYVFRNAVVSVFLCCLSVYSQSVCVYLFACLYVWATENYRCDVCALMHIWAVWVCLCCITELRQFPQEKHICDPLSELAVLSIMP